jgi:hypothetical protein
MSPAGSSALVYGLLALGCTQIHKIAHLLDGGEDSSNPSSKISIHNRAVSCQDLRQTENLPGNENMGGPPPDSDSSLDANSTSDVDSPSNAQGPFPSSQEFLTLAKIYYGVGISLTLISTSLVITRIWTRIRSKRQLQLDDMLIVAASVSSFLGTWNLGGRARLY